MKEFALELPMLFNIQKSVRSEKQWVENTDAGLEMREIHRNTDNHWKFKHPYMQKHTYLG